MPISPAQCRAARALLNINQGELSESANVSISTIRSFEAGTRAPHFNNLAAIRRALEEAGVEFLNQGRPGVRFNPVGAVHDLALRASLDAVLDTIQGMKSTAAKPVKALKTPWKIVPTRTGIECQNSAGDVLGSVRPAGESRLIFDPDIGDYGTSDIERSHYWLTRVRQSESAKRQG